MATTNAGRLKAHKQRMKQAGFRRLSFWVSAELAAKLERDRQPYECTGRVLERLLLGEAAKRPKY